MHQFPAAARSSVVRMVRYLIFSIICLFLSVSSGYLRASPAPPQTLALATSENPSRYGDEVVFTATYSSNPQGAITFYDNGTAIGTGTAIAGSTLTATLAISSLAVGSHSITAIWAEPGLAPVAPQAITQTVVCALPQLSWQPSPIIYGFPLTATMLDASSNTPGTFSFAPGMLGFMLGLGDHFVEADFTPTDSVHYCSSDVLGTVTVMSPTIVVSSPSEPLHAGAAFQFTATMSGSPQEPIVWAVDGVIGGNSAVGTITAGGVYTAPQFGNATVSVSALLQAYPTIGQTVEIQIVGPPGGISFTFDLPRQAATSAGVYDSSGDLVRTLWSNQHYSAGAQSGDWDGNDDKGVTVGSGTYEIRVLYNNVQYAWSVIGNTSASWTSTDSWDMQDMLPVDMAIGDGTAYTANQYSEGRPNASSFPLTNPQQPRGLFFSNVCGEYHFVATDGNLVYLANEGNGWAGAVAYIIAFNPATSQFYNFPSGQTYSNIPYAQSDCGGNFPTSVIDYQVPASASDTGPTRPNLSTGIAVQKHGNLLAVSHGAAPIGSGATYPTHDIIKLFDKTSGAELGTIALANPQRLAFAPDGDLWAVTNNSVVRITFVGSANTIAVTLRGLAAPIGIAVDPNTSDVLVADGGISQQVKRFSQSGQLLSTYGDLGGYNDCNPEVTDTRLFLDRTAGQGYVGATTNYPVAFLAVLPDSSYWVGDPGNARILHISAGGDYIEQISFLRFLYHIAADHGNPSRVFADDLEYSVDYREPIVPGDPDRSLGGNGSWKLVRNWWACLPSNYGNWLDQVQTFPNGRTYALIPVNGGFNELAELPKTGKVHLSGQTLGFMDGSGSDIFKRFTHDGNLSYWEFAWNDSLDEASQQFAWQQDHIGYDKNKWPVWGQPNLISDPPAHVGPFDPITTNPVGWYGWGTLSWPERTRNGMLVTYDTSPSTPGEDYHLGGVSLILSPPFYGANWSWKASPGGLLTVPDGKGLFPDSQSFGGHNGIAALVEGSNIIQGYDGQYGTFSSQWMHWNEDGLLIGQFGHPANGYQPDGSLWPAAAGNIQTMATATENGSIYLYNSDESVHPGIHRWKISNLGSIHELSGTANFGGTVALERRRSVSVP